MGREVAPRLYDCAYVAPVADFDSALEVRVLMEAYCMPVQMDAPAPAAGSGVAEPAAAHIEIATD